MQPLYIPSTDTVIRDPAHRYVHPTTGEVYGRSDYENPAKLAEIGAVLLLEVGPDEGYTATGWEIVDDPENAGWKIRRPSAVEAIPVPTADEIAAQKAAMRSLRYKTEADPYLIALHGYRIELEIETNPELVASIEAKAQAAKDAYIQAKLRIRQEIK